MRKGEAVCSFFDALQRHRVAAEEEGRAKDRSLPSKDIVENDQLRAMGGGSEADTGIATNRLESTAEEGGGGGNRG